ncbi:MAG: hypothetical protein V1780_01190 [Chloroflexota bacterium]
MKDKTLEVFLKLLFGLGGITLLVTAGVQPMLASERVLTASVGAIGLGWVFLGWVLPRAGKDNLKAVPAEVAARERAG